MTFVAAILILVTIWMFHHDRKGNKREYTSWKELFTMVVKTIVRYRYTLSPAKLAKFSIQVILIIYELSAFSIPFVRAGIKTQEGGGYWNAFIECQWDTVGTSSTIVSIVAIVIIAVVYLLKARYETETDKKILANTEETNEGINELKEQGNTILQAIQTQQKHPECTISFFADGKCTNQITIHPVYRQIHYIPKPKQAIGPTIRPRCVSPDMALGISGLMEAVNNARVQLGVSKQESAIRVNNGQIDYTLCPVQFVIRNTGDSALDNVKLSVWAKNPDAKWEHTNTVEAIPDLLYLQKLNYIINDDMVLLVKVSQLNAGDAHLVSVVYLNVPRTEDRVILEWELSSKQHKKHQNGQLVVQVQPEYKMVQVANDDLVGREDAYDAYVELL